MIVATIPATRAHSLGVSASRMVRRRAQLSPSGPHLSLERSRQIRITASWTQEVAGRIRWVILSLWRVPAEAAALVSDPVEQALDLFRAHGSRITTITPAPSPLSVRWHFPSHRRRLGRRSPRARPRCGGISPIYRNLEELERLGLIVHAHLGHGPAIYHLASEMHGHLVCEACGVQVEAPEGFFDALGELLGASTASRSTRATLVVLGLCGNCDVATSP